MKAINQFRAEEPEYHYLRKILPLQAELQGTVLENLKQREKEAWRLSDQAKLASLSRDAETALRLADEIISRYPNTGGSLLARKTKAQVLWKLKRRVELRATCQELLDCVGQVAPDGDLARLAASEIAFLDGIAICKDLEQRRPPSGPTPQDWQNLRRLCGEVMAKHAVPGVRAAMHEILIYSHFMEGSFGEVVKEEQRFLALYGIKRNYQDPEFKRSFVTVGAHAAQSLMHLGRYTEAIEHCERLITLSQSEPRLPTVETEACIKNASAMKCLLLEKLGAPREEIVGLAQEVESNWPESLHARQMSLLRSRLESKPAE